MLAGMDVVRVLLVDNSKPFLKSAADFLSRHDGVEVIGCASSGFAGVRLALELAPDLVLMDLSMPGMDGLAATRCMKAMARAPYVVIVSLHDQAAYGRDAAETGADGFICKSEFGDTVLAAIESLCHISASSV